jgi:hypothetical protein
MTMQRVTVIRREGEDPREFTVDDSPNPAGSPGRGASTIESLQRQVRREELHAVTVKPWAQEAPPEMVAAAAAKTAAKKESTAA